MQHTNKCLDGGRCNCAIDMEVKKEKSLLDLIRVWISI